MSGDWSGKVAVILHPTNMTTIARLLMTAMAKQGSEIVVMAKVNESKENSSQDAVIKAAIDAGITESAGRAIAERLHASGLHVTKNDEHPVAQEAKGAVLRVQDKDA